MDFTGDQFDVIVIGAGVMGSSTAYNTSKRGKRTLLLEQFDFLHHRGSSHGESRTIRSTYPEDYYSAMVIESSKLWQEAESEIGYKVYFETQQLDMGPTDDKSLQAVISNCQSNSSPHRILDSIRIRDEFSGGIHLPENWIAVVTEFGGVLKPTKAVSMFQTLAIKHGAVLRDNAEVVSITKNDELEGGGIFVNTVNGDKFWGRKCVVTVGAWMKNLIAEVMGNGAVLPIQPIETTVFYWKIKEGHEADFSIAGGFPTFASYCNPYIYGTPALEFPNLIKVAVHGGRELADPGNRTWITAGEMVVESLKGWIKDRFGGRVETTSGPVMTQSCLYSMTPDEDFVIDFLGGEFGKDVVVAGGFSGHGFKMAPVVGRVLADLALVGEVNGGGVTGAIKHFSMERFEKCPKGNVKDFDHQVNVRLHDDKEVI